MAGTMRDNAFAAAQRDAPQCMSDQDCVVMSLAIDCPNLVQLRDCGEAVHREVARRYAEMHVNEAICEAVEGAEIGCSNGPSCANAGDPQCDAGRCVRPLL